MALPITLNVDGIVYSDVSVALLQLAKEGTVLASLTENWASFTSDAQFAGKFQRVLDFLEARQSAKTHGIPVGHLFVLSNPEERHLLDWWGADDGEVLAHLFTVAEVTPVHGAWHRHSQWRPT
jgi:hypothetical protein